MRHVTDPNNIPPIPPSDPVVPSVTPPPMPPMVSDTTLSADTKSMAGLCHFFNVIFLVPLIIYLTKKDTSPFLKQESAEALNFSLTCLIAHLVLSFISPFLFCLPSLISLALLILQIVLGVIGGMKAKEGIAYKYPFSIPMITTV